MLPSQIYLHFMVVRFVLHMGNRNLMHITRLTFLLILGLAWIPQSGWGRQSQEQIAIKSGLKFLIQNQSDDGNWKSDYYGNLKQGAAITSLVLYAISNCDQKTIEQYESEIKNAFAFQRLGIQKNGYVSNVSGPDYAVYATSFLILANENFTHKSKLRCLSIAEIKLLQKFLCDAQLDETHGLTAIEPDYGGWDLSGWMQGKRTSPGTNVSVSSFAIQALASDQSQPANDAREKLFRWARRIQNSDGGFHFHPKKDHEGNKAGWADKRFSAPRSYGTATADGIRILKSLAKATAKPSLEHKNALDAGFVSAVRWIEQKPFRLSVPGFGESDDDSWKNGLFYYYSMSLALEMDLFSDRFKKQSKLLADFLTKDQQSDGSWTNRSTRMREDDPIIATCFAIVALCKLKSDSRSNTWPKN